jgi:hypothetical protein
MKPQSTADRFELGWIADHGSEKRLRIKRGRVTGFGFFVPDKSL